MESRITVADASGGEVGRLALMAFASAISAEVRERGGNDRDGDGPVAADGGNMNALALAPKVDDNERACNERREPADPDSTGECCGDGCGDTFGLVLVVVCNDERPVGGFVGVKRRCERPGEPVRGTVAEPSDNNAVGK
jgi:hypothetical protein